MTFLAKTETDKVMIEADNKLEAFELGRRYFGVQYPITLLRPIGRYEADRYEAEGCMVFDALDFDA